jgi:mono/diheme cytochrome c family protein
LGLGTLEEGDHVMSMKSHVSRWALSLLLVACGGGGSTSDAGSTGTDTGPVADTGVDASASPDSAVDDAGSDAGTAAHDASTDAGIAMDQCQTCHGENLGGGSIARGGVFPPNISPDPTHGIGTWTDDQILTAVRTGVDDEGVTLCSAMPRFVLTDTEAATLLTFLHGFEPALTDSAGGTCTAP